jgi:hypothetical protein
LRGSPLSLGHGWARTAHGKCGKVRVQPFPDEEGRRWERARPVLSTFGARRLPGPASGAPMAAELAHQLAPADRRATASGSERLELLTWNTQVGARVSAICVSTRCSSRACGRNRGPCLEAGHSRRRAPTVAFAVWVAFCTSASSERRRADSALLLRHFAAKKARFARIALKTAAARLSPSLDSALVQ